MFNQDPLYNFILLMHFHLLCLSMYFLRVLLISKYKKPFLCLYRLFISFCDVPDFLKQMCYLSKGQICFMSKKLFPWPQQLVLLPILKLLPLSLMMCAPLPYVRCTLMPPMRFAQCLLVGIYFHLIKLWRSQ